MNNQKNQTDQRLESEILKVSQTPRVPGNLIKFKETKHKSIERILEEKNNLFEKQRQDPQILRGNTKVLKD